MDELPWAPSVVTIHRKFTDVRECHSTIYIRTFIFHSSRLNLIWSVATIGHTERCTHIPSVAKLKFKDKWKWKIQKSRNGFHRRQMKDEKNADGRFANTLWFIWYFANVCHSETKKCGWDGKRGWEKGTGSAGCPGWKEIIVVSCLRNGKAVGVVHSIQTISLWATVA